MVYSTDDVVLDLSGKFQPIITADAGIVARVSASHSDPIIDAKLAGRGAPFTGTTPALIVLISSLFTASWIWANKLSQKDEKSSLAKTWYDQAWNLLNQIANGELTIDAVTDAALVVVADLDAEFQESTIFVGDELDWQSRTETRESA